MGGPGMQPRFTQSVTLTLRAFPDQAERWEAAAAIHGCLSVEGWISKTADAAARELARSGRPAPLPWFRDRFRVLVTDTSVRPAVTGEIEVRGEVSGYFGIFRGNSRGIGEPGCCQFSLVHRPTRRIIDTLPLRKACKALAAELASLRVNWQEKDPEKVVAGAPDQGKAQALLQHFGKLTRT
jgi:hypothetical protein